ncbi:hypothetical protein ACHWQZ_G011903 [Mnemiopsis leidyi]
MGNGASVQTSQTADIEDLFEDTVFNETEIKRISMLNAENGTEAILATLLPMPLLPHILSWLADQARKENLSEGITIEQIIYILDTLHPSQLIENKRDLAWKLYDIDEDGYITQSDLVGVLRYLLPSLPLSKYQYILEGSG